MFIFVFVICICYLYLLFACVYQYLFAHVCSKYMSSFILCLLYLFLTTCICLGYVLSFILYINNLVNIYAIYICLNMCYFYVLFLCLKCICGLMFIFISIFHYADTVSTLYLSKFSYMWVIISEYMSLPSETPVTFMNSQKL